MPSLIYTGPRESRSPDTEVLPDGRKRITRYLEVNTKLEIPAELNLTPGTPDIFTTAPTGWTGLLLTYFQMIDDVAPKGKDSRPMLKMTWEQISPTGETQVGAALERELPDGRIGYDLDYVMFNFNTFHPGVVGTDTAPNDALAFLQNVEAPDDGTLRKIKRTYVYAGELATDTQTKLNGALHVVTTTWAVTVPPTPSGYVLIGTPTQAPNGYPIYTYTFVMGFGQISNQIEYKMSPDNGGTGITINTTKFITGPTVVVDPINPPAGSGWALLTGGVEEADGYRIWTRAYANGTGIVEQTVEQRYDGNLVIYGITSINAAPSAPSPTIGGTVVLINSSRRNGSRTEDGVVVYEYKWAEGLGIISSDTESLDSVDNVNGIFRTKIRELVAPGDSYTASVGGAYLQDNGYTEGDGYRIWETVWITGQGIIDESEQFKFGGALVEYRILAINAVPSTPSATIGGTVELVEQDQKIENGYTLYSYRWIEANGLISDEVVFKMSPDQGTTGVSIETIRWVSPLGVGSPIPTPGGYIPINTNQYEEQEGYLLWTGVYAFGQGTISQTTEIRNSGALVIYKVTAINSAPSTPSGTLGGSVVLIDQEQRNGSGNADGVVIYDYTWAEGFGMVIDDYSLSLSGCLALYHQVWLGEAPPSAPTSTLGGTVNLCDSNTRQEAGYTLYDYRWAEGSGQAEVKTEGRADGSIDFTVVDLDNNGSTTPAYPGGGTGYLLTLEVRAEKGYFVNTALWRQLPASTDYLKTVEFDMPGTAGFSSPQQQLVLNPPARMRLLATATVSFDTSQANDTPYSVSQYAGFADSYTVASTEQVVSHAKGMQGYLSLGFIISGTNSEYDGQTCSVWQASIFASTPQTQPSGSTVLSTENDPYLTDIHGTVVFRRIVTSYTFP